MWLDKEQFKAKMECINLVKYNKLKMSEKDRRYELSGLIYKDIDFVTHKK